MTTSRRERAWGAGWASSFSGGLVTLFYLPAWIPFAFIVAPVIRAIRPLAARLAGLASPH
ncbi:MAG: hypothetical protein QNK03_06890 [Myxococcota bacterium]|nr:hypothetical protein [Myxococcota bacterium]